MKVKLIDLDKKELGDIELDADVFGLDVRPDIIKTVIDWQLAKRQAGTHQTKTISEVSGTTKKPHSQKGTGRARQGSLRQVHMRGGAVSHGPVSRTHEYDLPKKVRRLGLKHALSAKMEEQTLFVVKSFFLVDDETVDVNFAKACSNLHKINAVPQIGANVYDIVKHDCLLITEAAIAKLVARLK
jgi:large subunit ribosomal protein L4